MNNTWTTNLTKITIIGLNKGVVYQVSVKAVTCYGSLLGNESLILVQLTSKRFTISVRVRVLFVLNLLNFLIVSDVVLLYTSGHYNSTQQTS